MSAGPVTVFKLTVEPNKYGLDSMTIRFDGVPTVKQAVATARMYVHGVGVKPNFDHKSFEVHMVPEDHLTRVQFYPNISNTVCAKVQNTYQPG